MLILTVLRLAFSFVVLAAATPSYNARPFATSLENRQSQNINSSLQVDLGYDVYQGVANTSTGLNTWKGIRFAAPPIGSLRWQAPQPPALNRTGVIPANAFAPFCPQSPDAPNGPEPAYGNEDCLFLNVYAPANASSLPVLVWIHGGGYGAGNGRQDLSLIINANHNNFVGVAIQYRLGAFGFLSSDEVYRKGIVNAGLLDQHFALQWVQSYISMFGGNASQVTISGESAGGGSVMLQDMAYGGSLGSSLFANTIAASPYLPMQYGYKDWIPSQSYYAFATKVGCAPLTAYGSSAQTIFSCLVGKDTYTLQNASQSISSSGTYGTWGFLPVTDGYFVQQLPSQQLLQKKVNGQRLLVGNNANEGPAFTPQNITTEDDLLAWLHLTFPLFSDDDIAKILLYYPNSNASVDPSAPEYSTSGLDPGATAVNESDVATGQQQRADNIYAETTFVCPSYWMAEAYAGSSYKYQYSVPVAQHGADVAAYFGPATPNQGPDFQLAFRRIWGNFITTNNPSISAQIANGASSNGSSSGASNPASDWPPFAMYAPYQINLNETGGTPFSTQAVGSTDVEHNETEYRNPGLTNNFTLVNAYTWEGGRGYRCDFWRSVAGIVPE